MHVIPKFDFRVFSLEHEKEISEKYYKKYLPFGVQILHLLKQLVNREQGEREIISKTSSKIPLNQELIAEFIINVRTFSGRKKECSFPKISQVTN